MAGDQMSPRVTVVHFSRRDGQLATSVNGTGEMASS